MKINRRKTKNINIADSGALSDLAFLLIVFFIVIAVFGVNKGFMLGLPQKHSSKVVHIDDIIKVTLTDENELLYKNDPVLLVEIEKIVSNKLKQRPNMTFLLKIAPDATYQNVIDVLNIVQKLNIENFSFKMFEESE